MAEWVVLADDLTGACDTGVSFAGRGYSTRVSFDPAADFTGCDVRVLTTESRTMPAEQAAQAVEQALAGLQDIEDVRLYKKIDSTLRGHPGTELSALMHGLSINRALVCPAFPEQGRVVRGGQLFVHGTPIQQTSFAADVSEPDLSRLFAVGPGCVLVSLDQVRGDFYALVKTLSRPGILLTDAETSADLQVLARAGTAAGIRLFCGSAGLARGLVDRMPQGLRAQSFVPQNGPLLVIAGSRAAATLEQVKALREQGVPVVSPSEEDLQVAARLDALTFRIASKLDMQRAAALSVEDLPTGDAFQIASTLARLAAGVIRQVPSGGLVLTGGETAAAVCRALGSAAIDLGGEVQPGVVWGRFGQGPFTGLPVVTKAGGFGNRNTLAEALRFLTSAA